MQPSLDTWTSVFLLAVAMGLFLFLVLLSTRNKKNYPIAFLVLAFSIILFQYVLYWTRYETVFPYLVLIPPICYYATGPLLYLYFLNLYKRTVHFNYALHFIFAVVAIVPNVVMWLRYLGWVETKLPFVFLLRGHWIIAAHMAIYAALIIRLIYTHPERTTEYQKVRYNWAKILISLYCVFILSYVAYYVLVNFEFFNSEWDYMISIMMSVSIYAIGYFIIKQPKIFDGELFANLFLPIKNKDESFEEKLLVEFYENVKNYMEREKPFIDNELRLVHLADQLGFSTHLLSKVINKKSGTNFNTFVNEYRLSEAEDLLKSDGNQYIKNIYFDVGFNNKATFYKAFKQRYNCTPSEYQFQQRAGLES